MSSPSSAICPSVIVAEAIKSAVIGDAQEPYGATFCSGIVLLLTPGLRLLHPDSARAFTSSHWEYKRYSLVTASTPGEQRILTCLSTRCMSSLIVACSSYDTASRTIKGS